MKSLDLLLLVPRTMMLKKSVLSIGTLGLASCLASKGYGVRIVDDNTIYKKYRDAELLGLIRALDPNVIGISINVLNAYGCYDLLGKIRDAFPRKIIIAGGLHTYASADEIMEHDFDVVFRGESEISLSKFMELVTGGGASVERGFLSSEDTVNGLKKIGGMLFRRGGDVVDTGDSPIVTDLDELPFLDHSLANMEDFVRFGDDYDAVVNLVNFQRGCPYRCIYCKGAFMSGKIRNNSARHIFGQIKALHEKYGIDRIDIQDANFPIDRKRMAEFCDLMIESGLAKEVKIWCQTSAAISLSDDELVRLRDAGTIMLCIGVERFDDDLRQYMKKSGTREDVTSLIKKIHRHGIGTNMNILLNFPIDNARTLHREAEHLQAMLPYVDYFSVIYLVPIPGTEIYRKENEYHKWYLRPEIYKKIVSFYDMTYDVGTVGLEFNLLNLPEATVRELRRFKERFYKKNISSLDQSVLFKTAYHVNMILARLSYWVYSISPRAEAVLFGLLKKLWAIGFKIFKRKFYYKSPAAIEPAPGTR